MPKDSPVYTLSKAMQDDPDYAWGWFCNLAVMCSDAGAPHASAQEYAADFMKRVFEVDVRLSSNWENQSSQHAIENA